MKYLQLFTLHNLALLSDWLEENGELLVDIYRPHSGGDSFQYFVHSISELKQLVQKETWPEIQITIFREKQYSLRGAAGEKMLEKALSEVKDGEWYSIISLKNDFSEPIYFLSGGNTHTGMREDFAKLGGRKIGFGQDSNSIYSDEWFFNNSDRFFYDNRYDDCKEKSKPSQKFGGKS